MPNLTIHRQGQGVGPIEGVASCAATGLAHHIIGAAHIAALALVGESPNPFLCGAIRVHKVFVQHAFFALPTAVHDDGETFHHLARAVGEHAPRINHAVEVLAQIEHGFGLNVFVQRWTGAAHRGQGGGSGRREHQATFHGGTSAALKWEGDLYSSHQAAALSKQGNKP